MARIRYWSSAALAIGLSALAAGPAWANHPGGTVIADTVPGSDTPAVRHGDPRAEFKAGANDVAGGPGGISGRAAAPSVCPTVSKSADDTANSPHGNAAHVIKVIYAHPVDVGNRIGTYGKVIEAGARTLAEFAASESGGSLSVRFDIGTFEGPHCLDIQRVALPKSSGYYSEPYDQAFEKVLNDLQTRLGPQPGPRNYLIYADMVAPNGIAGEALAYIEPGVSDQLTAASVHNAGGLPAMLYGRGGSDFFGSSTQFAAGLTSRLHMEVALHELSHNLGAVQLSAPNSSGAGHCNDQYDLMCYEDGGPGSLFVDSNCDGALSPPTDPYGPDFQAWDCNKDDFFDPSPAPGSYLDTHWNLADSAFLCPVADCTPPDLQAPNTIFDAEPNKATRTRSAKMRFRATERSSFVCRVDGRKPRSCDSPFKVKLKRGKHTIKVTATDRAGLADPSPAKTKFRVLKRG